MRTETYDEEHPVALTEEEKRLRASTASRAWPRLAEQEATIITTKEAQKGVIKDLEAEKGKTIARAREASRAAHEGHEPRQVKVQQRFMPPNVVITVRLDTGETVHDRAATPDEIRDAEKAAAEAAKPKPMTPEQKSAKLAGALDALDFKPHPLKWILGKLTSACPEATPDEVKAAASAALDDGRLVDDGDKLRRVDGPPMARTTPDDGGIVPDDYAPAHH